MQSIKGRSRQTAVDRAVELLLIALCFTASFYGLVLLGAATVQS